MSDELELTPPSQAQAPTPPPEAPPETPPAEPPPETPPEGKHEPKEGSKRWDEMYWKAKEGERLMGEVEELKTALSAIGDHNKALEDALERIGQVEDKVSVQERPDPNIDPDGYDNWMIERAVRRIKKESAPAPKPTETTPTSPQEKILLQVQTAKETIPDYAELVTLEVEQEILADPLTRREVWGSDNPPLMAYKYARAKKARADAARSQNLDQGRVEGGGESPPPAGEKITLTPLEEKAAKLMGVDPEKVRKQKEFIAKRGY